MRLPRMFFLTFFLSVPLFLFLVLYRTSPQVVTAPTGGHSATAASFEEWSADPERFSNPSGIKRGIELATTRHARLKDLVRSNPDAALEQVMSLSEYAALPEEIRAYVERPVSAFADIDLQWATSFDEYGNRICHSQNRLYLDGESYALYGPGRRDGQPPALGVPVVAYLIDDLALVRESPVLPVSGPELAAAQSLFSGNRAQSTDPVTGIDIDENTAAVIGGTVYHFTAEAIIEHVEEELMAAEIRAAEDRSYRVEMPFSWLEADSGSSVPSGITESSYFADDNISVLAIRCDFSDIPGAPVSQLDLETDLAVVSGHLNTMSYGTASLTYSVTSTLYQPSGTGESYALAGDNDGLYTAVLADYDDTPDYLASAAYDVVMIYFPNLSGITGSLIDYGGLASVEGSRQWINGLSSSTARIEVITHEFGHNYGLFHSNYYHPEKGIGGTYYGDSLEYGDIFDLMGQGDITDPLNPAHFNMYQKNLIDWLPEANVADITLDGTYRVYRFDDINALDNPVLALRIPMGGGVTYWVGYRQLYTGVPNLANGIYVVADGLEPAYPGPDLVDMTPGSASPESADRFDAGLPVGNVLYDSLSGVTFTPLATGTNGAGDEWIDVDIAFDPRVGFATTEYEFDEARGVASVTVSRSFGGSGALSVDYATSDGSATAGTDYGAASGTINWADGDLSDKVITIGILPDSLNEGIETFTVTLSNPSAGTIPAGEDVATVSILDAGQRFATFTPDFFNLSVRAIDFQSDGGAIIGGTIDAAGGEFAGAGNIARLSLTGAVDASFNDSGTGFNGTVQAIVVQNDDKILVGGDFTQYNGTPANRLIRLNSNGSIDTTFLSNIGTGFDNSVYTIAIQEDGEILVGGYFGEFNSTLTSNLGLVRLADDGSPGASLSLPFDTGFGATIRDITIEPNGDFLVVGSFLVGWTGSGFRSGIARLNIDGTRDTGFDPDAGLHIDTLVSSIRTGYGLAVRPDGDIYVGGTFSAYDDNPAAFLARVNNDGTFDSNLAPSEANDLVRTILVEPFGGAILGGEFTSPDSRLMRIDVNMNHDTAFTSSGGPGSRIYTLAYGPDGSLWVGGNFFAYNGTTSNPIVRVASGVSPYEFWAGEVFTGAQILAGLADPEADLDGDELDNITELALGLDPTFADASLVYSNNLLGSSELVDAGGMDYLQISVDKAAADGGLWYVAQVSPDLVNWSPDPAVPGTHPAIEILEDTADRLTVRDATPVLPDEPRFIRLVFKKPE